MDKVYDNIYIGDKTEAQKRNRLSLNNVAYVVTLCETKSDYTTVHHVIEDAPLDNPEEHQSRFNRAVDIVLEALDQDVNILVHCAAGISRSPSVVATAIAHRENITLEDAVELVREERPEADPCLLDLGENYLSPK